MPNHRVKSLTALVTSAATAILLTLCTDATAGLVSYQDQGAFNLATAGWSANSTTSFEGSAVGQSYAAGAGPAGSGFSLVLTGPDAGVHAPTVSDQFWTTSGTHYLGLDNADSAFEAGDSLTFTFSSAMQAFGLYVIGTSDIGAGDITITAGGYSTTNGAVPGTADGNGSFAYFLGFVSDDGTAFTSVTLPNLTLLDPRLLTIAIDDVTLARNDTDTEIPVPEPATPVLFLTGLIATCALARRRAR